MLAAGTTLALLALAILAGRGAGEWLVVTKRIERCDLMVVPEGGAVERLSTAAELMSGGACGAILLTGPPEEGERGHASSILAVLDPEVTIEPASRSRSTFEDAIIARRVAEARGARSIMVVTSPYHTRRAAWAFDVAFAGSGVEVGFLPSSEFYMETRRWWETGHGWRAVSGEYAKLFFYGAAFSLFMIALATGAFPAG